MPSQTQQVETILKLNVDYEKGIKDVGAYLAEIKKLKDEQKSLDKAFKDGAISEQQYGDAMAKNKTVTTQLNGEMKVLTTELKKKLEYDRAEQKQIDEVYSNYLRAMSNERFMSRNYSVLLLYRSSLILLRQSLDHFSSQHHAKDGGDVTERAVGLHLVEF